MPLSLSWLLILLLITSCCTKAIVLLPRIISPDNSCGKTGTGGGADGYTCPQTLPCCSVNGFCGSNNAYCLTTAGCQTDFGNCTAPATGDITPDFTCGLKVAGNYGYVCTSEMPCCSSNGWCGNSTNYCSAGCQSDFGTCNNETTPVTGPGVGGTSMDGQCGPRFGTCASDECCSLEGYCGTSEDYCSSPDCLFNFGPACDANKIPTGRNTSSIPRSLRAVDDIYTCTVPGVVALTFDDGPFIYTSHILDLLAQYNAKATFFITGINNGKGAIDNTNLQWLALIKRMYSDGHQIASHTWSHADLCNITSAQRRNEMYKLEMAIRNILGFFPTYMRPPYSSCTAECGCIRDLQELGYYITYFDLDTQDYLNDSPAQIQKSTKIFDDALQGKSSEIDNFLVISHDIHNQTANVLTEHMLERIQQMGFRAVTLGACLGDPEENWYRNDT